METRITAQQGSLQQAMVFRSQAWEEPKRSANLSDNTGTGTMSQQKTKQGLFAWWKRLGTWWKAALLCIVFPPAAVVVNSWLIGWYAGGYLSSTPEKLPQTEVALVLGTSKRFSKDQINLYFQYRMEAAVRLFRSGKIKYLLVSGDNRTRYYNETADMRNDLIKRGIPKNRIVMDYAGFRTLDSVVRCHAIFGQKRFIVISQRFHNERAIFIGRKKGLEVYGYNARSVRIGRGTLLRQKMREYFARAKAWLDVYILDTHPKFYGKTIPLPR